LIITPMVILAFVLAGAPAAAELCALLRVDDDEPHPATTTETRSAAAVTAWRAFRVLLIISLLLWLV
jgi:hypothetical protein